MDFISFLATFLGSDITTLFLDMMGRSARLYLETLWPLFFVEQKRGWSATQGPLPTFFGIQDLSRRVMEFILRLDIGEARRRHTESCEKRLGTLNRGGRTSEAIWSTGTVSDVRVSGLPTMPTVEFKNGSRGGCECVLRE